jgi:hypothetical protein
MGPAVGSPARAIRCRPWRPPGSTISCRWSSADPTSNLWPEWSDLAGQGFCNSQDNVKLALARAVCAHRVILAAAHRAIASTSRTSRRAASLRRARKQSEAQSSRTQLRASRAGSLAGRSEVPTSGRHLGRDLGYSTLSAPLSPGGADPPTRPDRCESGTALPGATTSTPTRAGGSEPSMSCSLPVWLARVSEGIAY